MKSFCMSSDAPYTAQKPSCHHNQRRLARTQARQLPIHHSSLCLKKLVGVTFLAGHNQGQAEYQRLPHSHGLS